MDSTVFSLTILVVVLLLVAFIFSLIPVGLWISALAAECASAS